MRKRNVQFVVRLTPEEQRRLDRHVERSGLNRESYVRSLLNGYVPKEMLGADFFALMRELHAISNRMNQIAARANALGIVDAAQYADNAEELRETTQKIYEAVMLPEKI